MTHQSQITAPLETARSLRSAVAVRLNLIGPMQVWTRDGHNVLPLGRKTRALLAILALAAPRPVVRARLAEMLWSRRLEEQARASLRQEIHRLLDALQPVGVEILRVTRDHLAFRPEVTWVDVQEVMQATPGDPAALSLMDGELLSGFDGIDPALDNWLANERERLRDHARSVAQALLDERGAPETVLPLAQQLISIDRSHEGAWRAIMRVHAIRGERGLAIQAYERCRVALADMMDARPAAETQRLIAEIRAGGTPSAAGEPEPKPIEAPRAARGCVRIGVLPLQLIGTGKEEEALSIGLADEMTAAMARFRWLGLVSTSALAQSRTRDASVLRASLGLDFLLDGSVQRVGHRLRIAMRLLDLREGNQVVWARHFDSDTDDLLRMQDDVAAEVAAQIDPEMQLIEARRASDLDPADSSAYHLVLRALPLIGRLKRADFNTAGKLLSDALAIQPDYAAAHAARAYWAMFSLSQGWAERPSEMMAEAGSCADRAITLDPQDARGLTIAGHVRAYVFRRPREALELHSRALSLNPNLAMAWGLAATSHVYAGDLEEAARCFDRYRRLSPTDPDAFFFDASMVRLELARRNYELAVQIGRRATEINPFYSAGLQNHLAALGHAGLLDEAATVLQRLLAIEPDYTVRTAIDRSPYELPAMTEHFAAGLRLAGVPDRLPAEAVAP